MEKSPAKPNAGKAQRFRRCQQGEPVMAVQGEIDRNLPVHRMLSAANFGIPTVTAMPGIDDQRSPHRCSQGFQRIEKIRIMPVRAIAEFAAALAGKLSRREMRPAPATRIEQGNRPYQHVPRLTRLRPCRIRIGAQKQNAPEITGTSGAFSNFQPGKGAAYSAATGATPKAWRLASAARASSYSRDSLSTNSAVDMRFSIAPMPWPQPQMSFQALAS